MNRLKKRFLENLNAIDIKYLLDYILNSKVNIAISLNGIIHPEYTKKTFYKKLCLAKTVNSDNVFINSIKDTNWLQTDNLGYNYIEFIKRKTIDGKFYSRIYKCDHLEKDTMALTIEQSIDIILKNRQLNNIYKLLI